MRKLSSVLFRKHPGGIQARIKWVRWVLGYGLLSSSLLFVLSLVLMFSDGPLTVPVKLSPDVTDTLQLQEQLHLMPGLRGDVQVAKPDLLDRIMLDHPYNRPGWSGALFWILICWFLLRILNDLDLRHPFRMSISRHFNSIALVIFLFSLLQLLRWGYGYAKIRHADSSLMPDTAQMLSGFSGYFLLALMLTVIAYIYRMGCRMQKDQELTI